MTTTTLQRTEDSRLYAGVALVLTAGALALANFGGDAGENGGTLEYAGALAVCALLAAVLFGRVLPRAERPARAALITAAVGVVTLAAFWSGVPIVLGVAAVYAGMRADAKLPIAIGSATVVLACVACVLG